MNCRPFCDFIFARSDEKKYPQQCSNARTATEKSKIDKASATFAAFSMLSCTVLDAPCINTTMSAATTSVKTDMPVFKMTSNRFMHGRSVRIKVVCKAQRTAFVHATMVQQVLESQAPAPALDIATANVRKNSNALKKTVEYASKTGA